MFEKFMGLRKLEKKKSGQREMFLSMMLVNTALGSKLSGKLEGSMDRRKSD